MSGGGWSDLLLLLPTRVSSIVLPAQTTGQATRVDAEDIRRRAREVFFCSRDAGTGGAFYFFQKPILTIRHQSPYPCTLHRRNKTEQRAPKQDDRGQK